MAGSKTTNTAREVEMAMLSDISQAKAAPDADLQFLVQLETMILNHLRSQFGDAAGAMDAAAGGGPPPPGPPPGLAGPGGLASMPSGPGGMPSIPPDALAALGGPPGGPPPGGPPPGPPMMPPPPGPPQ